MLRTQLPQNQSVVQKLEASEPGAASLATYLYGRGGGFPVYENTAMTYFPSGEAKFGELLRQLETAEKYIFVEYFIIDEGLFWGRVLEVLARKAAAGVDVRVMYDGTCEFSTLPRDLPPTAGSAGHPLQGVQPGAAVRLHPLQLPRPPQDHGHRRARSALQAASTWPMSTSTHLAKPWPLEGAQLYACGARPCAA